MKPTQRNLMIVAGLVVLTSLALGSLLRAEFVCFDDGEYVFQNPYVLQGLTRESISWALTTGEQCNWHPLTWWSHMLDVQCFGGWAGGHHLVNLLFHVANTVLLFVLLNRTTGAAWRSATVAVLFAIHPLHVESVAWIAERKDVLSTFLGLWTILAYLAYVRRPSIARYILVAGLLVLGLMAKPMLVTLPFVLLLLDYWPLGRLVLSFPGAAVDLAAKAAYEQSAKQAKSSPWHSLVLEKVPLLVIAALSCVITYAAQKHGGAVKPMSLTARCENALTSYVGYLRKMLWPTDLTCFYPWPKQPMTDPAIVIDRSSWHVVQQSLTAPAIVAGLILLAITAVALMATRRGFRYAAVGWFWYLGTLVPVIGLVQVGDQAMADRYTYLPLIGIFILIAWGGYDLAGRSSWGHQILPTAAGTMVLLCLALTWNQVQFWQNTETLMNRVFKFSPQEFMAHNNLGSYYWNQFQRSGQKDLLWVDRAIVHWQEAVKVQQNLTIHYNLGLALHAQKKPDAAVETYRRALADPNGRANPHYADVQNNLGWILWKQGHPNEAATHLLEAIRANPRHAKAHENLALLLLERGQRDQAIKCLEELVLADPSQTNAAAFLKHLQSERAQPFPPKHP